MVQRIQQNLRERPNGFKREFSFEVSTCVCNMPIATLIFVWHAGQLLLVHVGLTIFWEEPLDS